MTTKVQNSQAYQASDAQMGEAHDGDKLAGRLSYGSYLKIRELLSLQELKVGDKSHDEHLFIILHQTYELWFRQVIYELDTIQKLIQCDELIEASRLLNRVLIIGGILVDQWDVLGTMRPRDYGHFRTALRPASGFQSAQFRELEIIMGVNNPRTLRFFQEGTEERERLEQRSQNKNLRDSFLALLKRKAFDVYHADGTAKDDAELAQAIVNIYAEPEKHASLYALCEALTQLDHWLMMWRYRHVQAVERVIGTKSGTGGSTGVDYLRSTLDREGFHFLIEVRACLDEDALFGAYAPPSCE